MATREKAAEQSGKTRLTDLPARTLEKAEQVKGGGIKVPDAPAQRQRDIIAI
jgi:hypothetical protein